MGEMTLESASLTGAVELDVEVETETQEDGVKEK